MYNNGTQSTYLTENTKLQFIERLNINKVCVDRVVFDEDMINSLLSSYFLCHYKHCGVVNTSALLDC